MLGLKTEPALAGLAGKTAAALFGRPDVAAVRIARHVARAGSGACATRISQILAGRADEGVGACAYRALSLLFFLL